KKEKKKKPCVLFFYIYIYLFILFISIKIKKILVHLKTYLLSTSIHPSILPRHRAVSIFFYFYLQFLSCRESLQCIKARERVWAFPSNEQALSFRPEHASVSASP